MAIEAHAPKTPEELEVDRIAVRNILLFEEKLNAETEEGRYKILAELLADELEGFELERCLSANLAPKCCLPFLDQRHNISDVKVVVPEGCSLTQRTADRAGLFSNPDRNN